MAANAAPPPVAMRLKVGWSSSICCEKPLVLPCTPAMVFWTDEKAALVLSSASILSTTSGFMIVDMSDARLYEKVRLAVELPVIPPEVCADSYDA